MHHITKCSTCGNFYEESGEESANDQGGMCASCEEQKLARNLVDLTKDLMAIESENRPRRYRPSNGTEGEDFYCLWCRYCERDAEHRANPDGGDGCDILLHAYAHGINDDEYPVEWTYSDGEPVCTGFVQEGDPLPVPVAPGQMGLFVGESDR